MLPSVTARESKLNEKIENGSVLHFTYYVKQSFARENLLAPLAVSLQIYNPR